SSESHGHWHAGRTRLHHHGHRHFRCGRSHPLSDRSLTRVRACTLKRLPPVTAPSGPCPNNSAPPTWCSSSTTPAPHAQPSPNTTSPTYPQVPPGWHYRLDSTRPSATTGSPAKTIKTPTSQKSSRQPTGSLMPLTTTNSAPPPTPASKPSALARV